MNKIMNVLLTGASGTVGLEVLHQLAPLGNVNLTVFDKLNARTKQIFAPYKNSIKVIYGDISRSEDIGKIPDGLDAVIHLAAIIPPLADEKPGLTYKVNVLGTKNLLEHLEATSPDVHLLYSSSIAVYGDRVENPNIHVNDPLLPGNEDIYAKSKIEAEKLIENSSIHWTIFRLAAIMKNHKISKLMFHMPLSTILEICTPEDAAKAFSVGIFKREELSEKIFNLGGGEQCCISYKGFLEKSFRLFGLGALNFPAFAFARRNFHCGRLVDGDKLEDILHFRHDTLESYFRKTQMSIPFLTRFFGSFFRVIIKKVLLNQSEPYKAVKTNNVNLINRFFGQKDVSLCH